MVEHLIRNMHTGDWSAITIDDNSDTAQVVTTFALGKQPTVYTWTKTSALMTLAWCQMNDDTYTVEVVR